MRAFHYCRVSTKEQGTEDHYSLDNQDQRCGDYTKLKRWRCAFVRKDIASGKNSDRIGFQDLLQAVREKKIDVVVVYRLDRLSRNVGDIYDFLELLRQNNVGFVSVTEGFDTTTAMGRAMLGVAAVFAQLTREMISENVKDGLLRRKEAGFVNGSLANTFGFDHCKESSNVVINPEEAAVVREIFDWYTESKWGPTKIASILNLRGVKTKGGVNWFRKSVASILRNPIMCGQLIANGKTIEGRHEGIVSVEQFEAAQAIQQSRTTLPNRSQQSRYLLSGILRCGTCGSRLAGHVTVNKKTGKQYFSYHHPPTPKMLEPNCPSIARSVHIMDDLVIEQIRDLALSGHVEKVVLKDVQSRRMSDHAPKIKERDKLLLELSGMDERFMKWADRLDSGKIDELQFEMQNVKLLGRRKQIQEQLQAIQLEVGDEERLELSLAEVKKTLQDFPQVWDALEHEERREVLRLLVESLHIFKDRAELKLLFMEPMNIPLKVYHRKEAPE